MKSKFALAVLALLVAGNTFAMEISRYFSDDMVLQRDKPVKVWGMGKKGEKVTVSFAGQTKTATADKAGRWVATLDPMPANKEGQELKVSAGSGKVELKNVLVGDVWLFGRQTYVDITLGRTDEGKVAAAKYKPTDAFRAITIETIPAKKPQEDLNEKSTVGWVKVDGRNALTMSAAAFYLGRDLVKELGVPVGIVDLNMSHHFHIAWRNRDAMSEAAELTPDDKEVAYLIKWMEDAAEARDSGKAQKDLDEYYAEALKKNPKAVKPYLGLQPLNNPMYPAAGYNAIINPLQNVTLKGVLLQLGNDYPFIAYREIEKKGMLTTKAGYDSGWQDNYMILKLGYRTTERILPHVPEDWRKAFGDKDLPIGLVLPPASDLDVYAAHNREIRELDRRTALEEGNIGLIMPGNENVPSSGQPADEQLLAERCKQWVLGAVSGKDSMTPTGPIFERMESRLSKATIYFKEGTADGLKDKGDALYNFEAAGPDRVFTPAKASIDGSTIKLKSDGPITFVRFNWTYKPDQGLINSAGLPALPFNTDADWKFGWIPPPEQADLPEEYSTTADKWAKSDVAIINGQIANLAGGDSAPIPIEPGPIGMKVAPFGPNMIVTSVNPGTPADGKLKAGDVIYGVNGKVFKDGPDVAKDASYFVLADAITYSESEEGEGKLVLSLRRGTKLMDVELQLKVMGSYSSTTPYYCEKSENIVKAAEAWSERHYRPETGLVSEPKGMLNTDLLFLLATGDPEYQGLVRRAVYNMIATMKPESVTDETQSKPWGTGHASLLLGEYFHATGDRNVLPYLKYQADLSAASQLKPAEETPPTKEAAHTEEALGGWRHNYPGNPNRWESGYGLLPHAGMGCVMGMELAKEAGLKIDELALKRGIRHFNHKRAEYGFVLYSYNNVWRDGPSEVNPEAEANGKSSSMNGKLGMAASLYDMLDGYNDTVEICARHCTYAFNNTRGGHGGMFFNNFWTPIGAWAGGEKSFKHFMKGQTWWRELFRRSDGAFNQAGRGGVGVSYAIPYVAPKQRLRMLGAPRSAFGTNCPAYLKPAVEAHKKRDYELCEKLVLKQMENVLPAEDMPVVNHLLESVRTLRASIDHDLDYVEKMIKDGKYYYASLEVPQLKGVVAANNPRLKAIEAALESPEGIAKIAEHRKECQAVQDAKKAASAPQAKKEKWINLIAQSGKNGAKESDPWKMKIVEQVSHAPEDWIQPQFDDSTWYNAKTPLSWTMYHTALFRGKFNVEDKKALDAIRVQGNFFQQQNVVVYLNGKLVAKIDNLDRGSGTTDARLTDYAMKLLKKGENTIAISSRHKRRWGSYRGTYKTAATVGFWVEARKAEE